MSAETLLTQLEHTVASILNQPEETARDIASLFVDIRDDLGYSQPETPVEPSVVPFVDASLAADHAATDAANAKIVEENDAIHAENAKIPAGPETAQIDADNAATDQANEETATFNANL